MATTLTNVGLAIMANRVIDALHNLLAPIYSFSLDLSEEAAKLGATIRVPLISADAADDWNVTTHNYKAGKATLKDREVKIDKRKLARFGIDDEQAASFAPQWWERKGDANANAVATAMLNDLYALITGAHYGDTETDKIQVTLAGFNTKIAAKIRAAAIKKNLNPRLSALCLGSDYFSALLGNLDANLYGGAEAIRTGTIPGLLGFKAVVEVPGYNGPGFVCQPDAIAVANRWLKPVAPDSYQDSGSATDDQTGLTIGIRLYGDPDTGVLSTSCECVYGVEVGNPDALLRIVE
jgi:hypothetical protein